MNVPKRANLNQTPSLRRIRVELSAHEWLIVQVMANKYHQSIGWVLATALRSWLEPVKKGD